MTTLDSCPTQQSPVLLLDPIRSADVRISATEGLPVTVRKLAALAHLTDEDRRLLASLRGRTVKAGSVVPAQGPDAPAASLILSGWCARISPAKNDRHQVISVMLPGDAFGLGASPWAGDQLSVLTLTACVLVNAVPLQQVIRLRSPVHSQLVEACHRLSWQEQTHSLNHIVRLAGRDGYQRVAHLIADLYMRMQEVDLIRDKAFAMPLAQKTLAAMLGISKVHLNRVTRQLQREGLVEFTRGAVRVPAFASLADVAAFESFSASQRH